MAYSALASRKLWGWLRHTGWDESFAGRGRSVDEPALLQERSAVGVLRGRGWCASAQHPDRAGGCLTRREEE